MPKSRTKKGQGRRKQLPRDVHRPRGNQYDHDDGEQVEVPLQNAAIVIGYQSAAGQLPVVGENGGQQHEVPPPNVIAVGHQAPASDVPVVINNGGQQHAVPPQNAIIAVGHQGAAGDIPVVRNNGGQQHEVPPANVIAVRHQAPAGDIPVVANNGNQHLDAPPSNAAIVVVPRGLGAADQLPVNESNKVREDQPPLQGNHGAGRQKKKSKSQRKWQNRREENELSAKVKKVEKTVSAIYKSVKHSERTTAFPMPSHAFRQAPPPVVPPQAGPMIMSQHLSVYPQAPGYPPRYQLQYAQAPAPAPVYAQVPVPVYSQMPVYNTQTSRAYPQAPVHAQTPAGTWSAHAYSPIFYQAPQTDPYSQTMYLPGTGFPRFPPL